MSKLRVYKGRESVRDAMRILNHSTRFIIIAHDENDRDLPLYCSGYPAKSAVADQLLKIGVAMLRQHRQEMEDARLAAGLPVSGESAPAPEPDTEVRVVNPLAELVLPAGSGAPPAFGKPEEEEGAYIVLGYGDLDYTTGIDGKRMAPHSFPSLRLALEWLEQEWKDRLDPEDDRVVVWGRADVQGEMRAVWHFSGWHWHEEEFGLPQGCFWGHEKEVRRELEEGDDLHCQS